MFITVDQLKATFPGRIVNRLFEGDDEKIQLFINKIERYMPQHVKQHLSENPLACWRFVADCFDAIEKFKYARTEAGYNNSRGYSGFLMEFCKGVAESVCGSFEYDWLFKDYNWPRLSVLNTALVVEQAKTFSPEAVNYVIAFGRFLYDHSTEAVEAFVAAACDMKRYVVANAQPANPSLVGADQLANGLLDNLSPLFDAAFPVMGDGQYQYFCNTLHLFLSSKSFKDQSYGHAVETLQYAIGPYFRNRQIKKGQGIPTLDCYHNIALENLKAIQMQQWVTQKEFFGAEVTWLGIVTGIVGSSLEGKIDRHKAQIRLGIAKMKVEGFQLRITASEKNGDEEIKYHAKADRALLIAESIEKDTNELFGTPGHDKTAFTTGECKDYEQKISNHLSKGDDLLRDNSTWRGLSVFLRNAACCVCTLIIGYPIYLWATRDSRTTMFLDYKVEVDKSSAQKVMDAIESGADGVGRSSGLGG